ncbi:MAG: right-handed parallel beta-helix repeat-containing protein [Casimicrobiaceae bacterium]
MRCIVRSLVIVSLLATPASLAFAAQRTFVSGIGSDSNACSLVAPCRSIAAALLKTAPDGEIILQDSAGYGPVTIAQSVSIVAPPGVYGGISIAAGAGITITGTGINVTLKGLTINGQGGTTGIDFQGASLNSKLRIESVEIANLTGNGITVSAGSSEVLVIDSIIRDTGGVGIEAMGSSTITVDRSRFDRNVGGIFVHDGPVLFLSNSVIANSTVSGIRVVTPPGFSTTASIESCSLTGAGFDAVYLDAQGSSSTIDVTVSRSTLVGNQNGVGINASAGGGVATAVLKDNVISKNSNTGVYAQFAGATAILSGNTITGNLTGVLSLSAGVLKSFGNNSVVNNTTNGTGSLTPVPSS